MSAWSIDGLLSGEYGWSHYPYVHAKSVNLARKLKDAYDTALSKIDLLIMPTTVTPADPLPDVHSSPLVQIGKAAGKLENTSAFNASGHPALESTGTKSRCSKLLVRGKEKLSGRTSERPLLGHRPTGWQVLRRFIKLCCS